MRWAQVKISREAMWHPVTHGVCTPQRCCDLMSTYLCTIHNTYMPTRKFFKLYRQRWTSGIDDKEYSNWRVNFNLPRPGVISSANQKRRPDREFLFTTSIRPGAPPPTPTVTRTAALTRFFDSDAYTCYSVASPSNKGTFMSYATQHLISG